MCPVRNDLPGLRLRKSRRPRRCSHVWDSIPWQEQVKYTMLIAEMLNKSYRCRICRVLIRKKRIDTRR